MAKPNKNHHSRSIYEIADQFLFWIVLLITLVLTYLYLNAGNIIEFIFAATRQVIDKNNSNSSYNLILGLSQNVISNLIPTCILFVIAFLFLREVQEIRSINQTNDLLSKIKLVINSGQSILQDCNDFGISSIHRRLGSIDMENLISNSESIKILTILPRNPSDYGAAFNGIPDSKNCKVQILFLDPGSQLTSQISQNFFANKEYISNSVRLATNVLKGIQSNKKLNDFNLAHYSIPPSVPMYIFDNYAYFGFFSYNQWPDNEPWFGISTKNTDGSYTKLGEFLNREFDKIWSSASPITH